MSKRKFIDRKHAVSFNLVYRSQQDPLVADENAPQRVLVPEKNDKHVEEQQKYGVYYDDNYDYLQHLRKTSDVMEWKQVKNKEKKGDRQLNLPSSVFASNVEEDVGLLNRAAPESGLRLDLDFDVVAAMDDDFDYEDPENKLEENFMELANAECSDEESQDDDSSSEVSSSFDSEERDEVCSLEGPQYSFKNEETKSRFTKSSMSSSVIKRNEQLQLLDRRFDQFFLNNYDDSQIGALEVEGPISINSQRVLEWAKELDRDRAKKTLDDIEGEKSIRTYSDSDSDYEIIEVPEKPEHDCVSILSTYSNTYNLPVIIDGSTNKKIKINKKTGMPVDVFNSNKLNARALEALHEENAFGSGQAAKSMCGKSDTSRLSAISKRSKCESSEEKRERKRAVREYRKERRLEKKANKQAFKEEGKKQVKIAINNRNNNMIM